MQTCYTRLKQIKMSVAIHARVKVKLSLMDRAGYW